MCFGVMNTKLKRNIYGITNSSIPTSEIEGLVARSICEELAYVCTFWTTHILDAASPLSPDLVPTLRHFLAKKLLF
jgi:hypothetical protein